MKIEYRILWIEDHFDSVKQFIHGLENRFKKHGFNLTVDEKSTISDQELDQLASRLAKYNPYDMIIFDYDLGQQTGDHIAHQLRTSIFTDMIFYSGKDNIDVRKQIYKNKIDGVFIVHRPNFLDDAWPILEDHLKKICDINNMRGVLLDEMSKIDLKIRSILSTEYSKLEIENKERQNKKLIDKYKERIKDIEKNISTMTTVQFPENIKNPLKTEFNIVRNRINSILKNDELFGENGKLKIKQDMRNKFAHNMAVFDDAEGTVTLSGYPDEKYDFEYFTNLRKDLIYLNKELENHIPKT